MIKFNNELFKEIEPVDVTLFGEIKVCEVLSQYIEIDECINKLAIFGYINLSCEEWQKRKQFNVYEDVTFFI